MVNTLFLITQYLFSAVLLTAAFKKGAEFSLVGAVLMSCIIGIVFMHQFDTSKKELSISFLCCILSTVIANIYLQYKIITDFSFYRIILFCLNILILIIYFLVYTINMEDFK